jgi:two-component system, cell cycle sensor histidine kinase and response regulator CckA
MSTVNQLKPETLDAPLQLEETFQRGPEGAKLRDLLESLPGAWFCTRIDGAIAYANQAAADMHGYELRAMLELEIFDLNPMISREAWRALGIAHPKGSATVRTVHRHRSGLEFPVEAVGSRLQLGDSSLILSYVVNLSSELEARAALAEKEGLLAAVLAEAPIALFRVNAAGDVVLAEGSALAALGAPSFGPANEVFATCPALAEATKSALAGMDQAGTTVQGASHLEYRVQPSRDATGTVRGAIGVVTDVTHRWQIELERRELLDRLRESQKMEAIGRLAASVAHDFNNLLQIVSAAAGICLKAEVPAKVTTRLHEIEQACECAGRIVHQLLTLGAQSDSEHRILDLTELVRSLLPTLESLLGTSHRLEFIADRPKMLTKGDRSQLEQVLLNLCGNARDAFVAPGSVSIGLYQVSDAPIWARGPAQALGAPMVVLEVKDSGPGIPADLRERIFEPFFSTRDAGTEGRGLGLATVYSVVQKHGGAIDVESPPGQGATFRIYLPLFQPPTERPRPITVH